MDVNGAQFPNADGILFPGAFLYDKTKPGPFFYDESKIFNNRQLHKLHPFGETNRNPSWRFTPPL
jgi:hypothetical protein